MKKSVVSLLLLVGIVASGQLISPSRAAWAETQVVSESAFNQFPAGVQFRLVYSNDVKATDVRLRFHIVPNGVSASVRANCNDAALVSCTANVSRPDTVLSVGSELEYFWEIRYEDGTTFMTDRKSFLYDDTRFEWDLVSDDLVKVYYYFGSVESAESVLEVAHETLETISQLYQYEPDFTIDIWVYRTVAEMADATGNRDTASPGHTLGQASISSNSVIVAREVAFLDIVQHEVAHIVTRNKTKNFIAGVPLWINEGVSVFAQSQMTDGHAASLAQAIRTNRILPVSALESSLRSNNFSLAYGQSGAMIGYLVNTYGPEKFAEFIDSLNRDTVQASMEAVYGFGFLGFENEFRVAVGLPEFDPNAPTPATGQSQSPAPTATPRAQPQGNNNDSNNNRGNTPAPAATSTGDGLPVLYIALGGLVVVFVGLLAAAGILAMKGRGTPGT